ncbi:hypothetical protein ACI3PL_28560, partial [Lacticaseibacillus paracasei]
SLTGKPTTIAGYGITDFNTLGDARYFRISNNLTEGTASSIRANLGLGTLSLLNSINNSNWVGTQLADANIAGISYSKVSGTP